MRYSLPSSSYIRNSPTSTLAGRHLSLSSLSLSLPLSSSLFSPLFSLRGASRPTSTTKHNYSANWRDHTPHVKHLRRGATTFVRVELVGSRDVFEARLRAGHEQAIGGQSAAILTGQQAQTLRGHQVSGTGRRENRRTTDRRCVRGESSSGLGRTGLWDGGRGCRCAQRGSGRTGGCGGGCGGGKVGVWGVQRGYGEHAGQGEMVGGQRPVIGHHHWTTAQTGANVEYQLCGTHLYQFGHLMQERLLCEGFEFPVVFFLDRIESRQSTEGGGGACPSERVNCKRSHVVWMRTKHTGHRYTSLTHMQPHTHTHTHTHTCIRTHTEETPHNPRRGIEHIPYGAERSGEDRSGDTSVGHAQPECRHIATAAAATGTTLALCYLETHTSTSRFASIGILPMHGYTRLVFFAGLV
jgi:hypothetical protein